MIERERLTAKDAETVDRLSPEQLTYAYAKKLRELNKEDAKAHTEVLLHDDQNRLEHLTEEDYDTMAASYEENHDANRSDNEQWDQIIWNHLNG